MVRPSIQDQPDSRSLERPPAKNVKHDTSIVSCRAKPEDAMLDGDNPRDSAGDPRDSQNTIAARVYIGMTQRWLLPTAPLCTPWSMAAEIASAARGIQPPIPATHRTQAALATASRPFTARRESGKMRKPGNGAMYIGLGMVSTLAPALSGDAGSRHAKPKSLCVACAQPTFSVLSASTIL